MEVERHERGGKLDGEGGNEGSKEGRYLENDSLSKTNTYR